MKDEVKGTVMRARQEFLRQEATPEQSKQIFQLLSQEVRGLLEGEITLPKWYPASYHHEVNQAIIKIMGKGGYAIMREVGKFGADLNIKSVYKSGFMSETPEGVPEKMPIMWSTHYAFGEVQVFESEKGRVVIGLKNCHRDALEIGEIIVGWATRLFELCHGQAVSMEASASPNPEFNFVWTIRYE